MIPIPKQVSIHKKYWIYALNGLLSLFILVFLAVSGLFLFYISSAPKLSEESLTATTSSLIYDSQGNLIADLGSEKRTSIETGEIPKDLVNAILAIEDHRFLKHRGIDIFRIAGAFLNNITSTSTQGGSTLDQQLIKLTYFSTSESDQTLKRKAQEAWLSLKLERRNTKAEILTYYVNKVYMSNGNYGMQTAAQAYYGKDLVNLTLSQMALLAGMPQAPNQYDPYTQPEAAKARRDIVLAKMLEHKYISPTQYEAAKVTPVTDGLIPLKKEASYEPYMDNYLKQVIEEVQDKTGYNLLTTGMQIYTNVNSDIQRYLYEVYNTDNYVVYPDDTMQVASTIIDVSNGHVVAQLGSRKQTSNVSFGTNQAVETNRDWGSTMKPITDYAPALEYGIYLSTAAPTYDAPYYYPGSTTPVYNWDKGYFGNITISYAIQTSRNIPAIKALEAVGLDQSLKFLNGLGINYPEMHFSNAISSNTSKTGNEYGASSEKMAAAYAAFANGGIYYTPQYVNKIVFSDDSVVEYQPEGSRAMSETTAYMMTEMMKTVLYYGTGQNAALPGVYQAGKTGTSNYSDEEFQEIATQYNVYTQNTITPDENFVGYTDKFAMAVWTGYTNRMTPVMDSGIDVATDVYKTMISYLVAQYGNQDWIMPEGLYRNGTTVGLLK